jgi:hypothetical protein
LIEGLGLTGTLDVLGIGVLVAVVLTMFLPETRGKTLDA